MVRPLRICSMRQRIHCVVDTKLESGGGVVHRHSALIDPLKELADVVIVVQDHLQISMGVTQAKKFHRQLARENIWGRHVERLDLIKDIEDRIG